MNREKLLELWEDMWLEGNWVPSFPDTLREITAEEANWKPSEPSNSIWQEVIHIIFWRIATLNEISGLPKFSRDEIETQEFAEPTSTDAIAWAACIAELEATHRKIALQIQDESADITRIPYHLIHDAYHLGRITQLRAMQGTGPKF